MADDEATNPPSPASSTGSTSSSRSSSVLPEALVHGREKRATAGNKLRALLDAEFQEEEIFKEDEDDEEFERQKSDEGEDFLSESESSGDEDQQDEEEGEKVLIAQQKTEAKRSRERKRKANEPFNKPVPKRRPPPKKETPAAITTSKPASTASSVSNRRISFDPTFLTSRRSSRALTVQTTNETHSRIISAAARRATLPVIPRREQTPPLTQEERLAQAILTEEENKLSLKRIVEAEEERARKRREKLEALRRRRFDEPILRFISRRRSLIEEIPVNDEEDVVVVDDGEEEKEVTGDAMEIKQEPTDIVTSEDMKDKQEGTEQGQPTPNLSGEQAPDTQMMDVDELEAGKNSADQDKAGDASDGAAVTPAQAQSEPSAPEGESDNLPHSNDEKMEVDKGNAADAAPDKTATQKSSSPAPAPSERDTSPANPSLQSNSMQDIKTNEESEGRAVTPATDRAEAPEAPKDTNTVQKTTEEPSETPHDEGMASHNTPPPVILPSTPTGSPKLTRPRTPSPPKTPPPYHEAHFTANTLSLLSLPGAPLQSTRDTFFPTVPVVPPPKPKPCARCPITGLPARYKDPLSGVGYYDIHAFKILREVGRKGSRYVWCSEGGWFVGETGWGGRAAKGVPEGWNG
jgi:vacuolar protein sorting-associated protein 72